MKSYLPWIILTLLALAVLVAPLPVKAAAPTQRTIRIQANSFEFTPGEIRVNQGDTVTLEVVSQDVVHGVYVDGYNLQVTADPGQTARLTFVAGRPGVFRLRCSVTCGALHPFMIGKLHVGANGLLLRALGLGLVAVAAVFLRKQQ
jgi:heme/copper-type cytochrome/quinol oxidase subunit 2